jgi:LCP family protein required for cell wall assembly
MTPTRPRRRTRLAAVLVVVLTLVAGGLAVALMSAQSHLAGQVRRVDVGFDQLRNRPARVTTGRAAGAFNILVMGTDRRSAEPTTGSSATASEWVPGAQRTDPIMVLHVDGDRRGATVVSLPRDSWVDVPGLGSHKINAAFSLAGPSLAVETVEQLTGVRIDHLAVVDWAGFEALVDEVGGVGVMVPMTVEDSRNHVVWSKGRHRLSGSQALLYVRQRYGLAQGDLDRVRRQQAVVRALARSTGGTVRSGNPLAVYGLLDTLTSHLTVDSEWEVGDMRSLLLDLAALDEDDTTFLTAPVASLGRVGAQSVVHLDEAANRSLWEAVREDRVDEWIADHPDRVTRGPVA